jgi:hypothetical protein
MRTPVNQLCRAVGDYDELHVVDDLEFIPGAQFSDPAKWR